jgi:hypothetical protein
VRIPRTIAALFVPIALVTAPSVAADSDDAPRRESNVLVKITVGRIENGDRKPMRSYQVLTPGGGGPARINTSNRIPIPAMTAMPAQNEDGAHIMPVTSFSYQNVGFQASVRTVILGSDTVKLSADIEDAALYNPADINRKPGAATAPVVTSFTQTISDAIVRKGSPLITTVVDDPKGQSMYVQIGAEIQK